MKVLVAWGLCALAVALLVPASALAQTAPAPAFTVLPPPALDAPGARAVAPPEPTPATTPATTLVPAPAVPGTAIPIPALPSMQQDAPRDARGDTPPTVKVLKHDGQMIEQYYEGGQLYMVQVHPKHGVTYTYFVEKGHNLRRSPGAPKVSPVLYTILEWGKPDKSK